MILIALNCLFAAADTKRHVLVSENDRVAAQND
jgi:hypothetical protein